MGKVVPEISIVIPLHNEEENVELLYKEIRNSVDRLKRKYEIIFVDDGSSDGTFEYLKTIKKNEREERKNLSNTKIIRFTRNFGQTAAMQAGFDHARGEIIVSLDGDLQNDPNEIGKLITELKAGYDVVCGWRKNRKDKIITRIIPSRVANWLIRRITNVPIHDTGCSLRAYRRSAIKAIRLYSDMHRFIPAVTTLAGARMGEIAVNHRPRKFGQTKYGLSRIWKVLFDVVTIKLVIHCHHRPILWFGTFGLFFYLLGLLFGIVSVLPLGGQPSVVYSGASFLLLSLSGSLVAWGILAELFVKLETTDQLASKRKTQKRRLCLIQKL